MVNDQGCPTCSSKNFGNLEMRKNNNGTATWKKSVTTVKNSGTLNRKIKYFFLLSTMQKIIPG